MIIRIDAQSDTGCVREHNEDMILVHNEQIRDTHYETQTETDAATPLIYAVADGMGGHNGGEFASELTAQHLEDAVHELQPGLSGGELQVFFNQWVQQVHQLVIQKGIDIPEFYNMGTTLAGILVYNNRYYWMNIGDSRIYRFRNGLLTQVSTDHSMCHLYDSNVSSNIICNSIGAGQEVFIDFDEIPIILDGDIFLLCSDGLTDMVPPGQVESLLSANYNSTQLVEAAKQAGGKDNVSVLLLYFSSSDMGMDNSAEKEDLTNTKPYRKVPFMESNRYRETVKYEESETDETLEEEMPDTPDEASDYISTKEHPKEEKNYGLLKKLNKLFSK